MGDVFSSLDIAIFFIALVGVMAVGVIVGRKEESSEDYFLAGRKIPWWGVAGSIFGSNVSANHMVGMMGIGFSVGFAQSHFELGAIFGLLALCYGFLPVYRRLRVYTLSEYLGRRYDDRSRMLYAVIMVIIMAGVQMVPGLYIGSRTICVLLGGDAVERVEQPPQTRVGQTLEDADDQPAGDPTFEYRVNKTYYAGFVIALAVVSAGYTILGGLKAVIWTDVIQSFLLLAAGIGVSLLTFDHFGGWGEMMAVDAASSAPKMHLYLPSWHPQLPWSGVFTGLIAMHCFYWGTNQFIVQRALGARSDAEARVGIIAAGFLKLIIPFFAIGTGVAAYYLFQREMPDRSIDPDTAFSELVILVVAPFGMGIIGLISAGLIGAILSSIDSMMNSAATILTIDIYKRFINPNATERQLIRFGRISIVVLVVLAAILAITVLDPNSKANFFLQIANYQNYLTPGILVAFVLGMFWRRATATGALAAIFAGVFFSWGIERAYNETQGMNAAVYNVLHERVDLDDVPLSALPKDVQSMSHAEIEEFVEGQREELTVINKWLGPQLNFFHRVVGVIGLCIVVHIVVSLMTRADPEKGRLVWTDLGGHAPGDLRKLLLAIGASIGVFAVLGGLLYADVVRPLIAGCLASAWTLAMYGLVARRVDSEGQPVWIDRAIAAVLCSLAVFMHYYFY